MGILHDDCYYVVSPIVMTFSLLQYASFIIAQNDNETLSFCFPILYMTVMNVYYS